MASSALLRAVLAFVAGVLTGTVLAVLGVEGPADAITHTARLLASLLHGLSGAPPEDTGSLWRVVVVAEWRVALTYSAILGALAAPIWYGLGRIGANRLWHAATLGLLLGAIAGALVFFKAADGPSAEYIEKIAVFGLVGSAAGLAEWAVGRSQAHEALMDRSPNSSVT